MAENHEKAYVVVRRDMSVGYQIVQAAHAAADHERWFPNSMSGRTMVVLSVANVHDLACVFRRVRRQGVPVTLFYEPDIDENTAFAASPSEYWDEFVGLPLAGQTGDKP